MLSSSGMANVNGGLELRGDQRKWQARSVRCGVWLCHQARVSGVSDAGRDARCSLALGDNDQVPTVDAIRIPVAAVRTRPVGQAVSCIRSPWIDDESAFGHASGKRHWAAQPSPAQISFSRFPSRIPARMSCCSVVSTLSRRY